MVGPLGKLMELTDPDNPGYGVKVEVAPGQLEFCRTFYLVDDQYNVPPEDYLPVGFNSGLRRREGAFAVSTAGEPPYEVEMKMTFPLSVTDTNLAPGEVLCAFYFDKTANRWSFVLPESIQGNSMTVVTTYRETWNWGRVDVAQLPREYLEPALKERMTESEWAAALARFEEIGTQIESEDASYTQCTDLRSIQRGLLEAIKQAARSELIAAKPLIDPVCGSCDPLSDQFLKGLETFIKNNAEMWIMELFADNVDNIVVEFALRLDVLICDFEIRNLACDYGCVHEAAGGGFWVDYGEYQLAGTLQYLIDWYIDVGPLSCP